MGGGTSKTRPIKPPTAMSHEKVRKALNAVMKESNRNAYGAPIWSDGCRELAGCQGIGAWRRPPAVRVRLIVAILRQNNKRSSQKPSGSGFSIREAVVAELLS